MSKKSTLSEEIRNFCKTHYIEPAKEKDNTVTIKPGEICRELGLPRTEIYTVSAALGTKIFERENNLKRVSIKGSFNGTESIFTFQFIPLHESGDEKQRGQMGEFGHIGHMNRQ